MKYDFTKLWSTHFFGFYDFKTFYEYASDKDAQIDYYKKRGAIRGGGEQEEVIKIETPKPLIDIHVKGNESALERIKNNFIVFLFARFESVIQDTMKCLICDNSGRILQFIKVYPDYEKYIGFSLKEFIEYDSKEEYISIISERLSSRILTGQPSKVIKRLKCLLKFDEINTSILDDLMMKRNKIVHEGKVYEIELDELELYYETIDELLKNIALALKNIRIWVIDSGNLLAEE